MSTSDIKQPEGYLTGNDAAREACRQIVESAESVAAAESVHGMLAGNIAMPTEDEIKAGIALIHASYPPRTNAQRSVEEPQIVTGNDLSREACRQIVESPESI